jgi:DNA-directed RNA polymerase II subunit RPB2
MKPDQSKLAGTRHAVYDKLNEKGYVPEETLVVNGDVIIGKVTPIQPAPGSNKCYKDSSEIYKSGEPAYIDRVFNGITDSEGSDMIKMRTRSIRIPKIGDKFCMVAGITDVLTSEGWLKMSELTLTHKIATLVNGNKLEYVRPTGLYRFNYKGKIYKVRSEQVDLDVTLDHELYVKLENKENYELIKAVDVMGKKYQFKKNCEFYDGSNLSSNKLEYYSQGCFDTPKSAFNTWAGDSWDGFDKELKYYVNQFIILMIEY